MCGGHGVRAGGEPDGDGPNCNPESEGNVLIIQESDKPEPDDNAQGGTMSFSFDPPVHRMRSIGLIDVDAGEQAFFEIYKEGGGAPIIQKILGKGGNLIQMEKFSGIKDVNQVSLVAWNSFGVRSICFCPDLGGICIGFAGGPDNSPSSVPTLPLNGNVCQDELVKLLRQAGVKSLDGVIDTKSLYLSGRLHVNAGVVTPPSLKVGSSDFSMDLMLFPKQAASGKIPYTPPVDCVCCVRDLQPGLETSKSNRVTGVDKCIWAAENIMFMKDGIIVIPSDIKYLRIIATDMIVFGKNSIVTWSPKTSTAHAPTCKPETPATPLDKPTRTKDRSPNCNGYPGLPGTKGIGGIDGEDAPIVELRAKNIVGIPRFHLVGQDGQQGGQGGTGGMGGRGAKGRKAKAKWCICQHRLGYGGNSGEGGHGGDGGDGGNGGRGGKLEVFTVKKELTEKFLFVADGGSGGEWHAHFPRDLQLLFTWGITHAAFLFVHSYFYSGASDFIGKGGEGGIRGERGWGVNCCWNPTGNLYGKKGKDGDDGENGRLGKESSEVFNPNLILNTITKNERLHSYCLGYSTSPPVLFADGIRLKFRVPDLLPLALSDTVRALRYRPLSFLNLRLALCILVAYWVPMLSLRLKSKVERLLLH